MYTSTSDVCFFLIFLLLESAATWDKVQSSQFNFCCLIVPARKAHLALDRYRYLPKTVFFFFTGIEFWASSEMCRHR